MNWYSNKWKKRKEIVVSNNTASAIYNRVFSFTFDHASLVSAGASSDGADLIITADDGETEMPMWIAGGLNSASCTIYTRFNYVPASSSVSLYIYYEGDRDSVSNPYLTFDFFEDFMGSQINYPNYYWQDWNLTGNYNISNSIFQFENTSERLLSQNSYSDGVTQEVRFKVNTMPTNGFMVGGFYSFSSDCFGILAHPTTTFYVRNDGSWVNLGSGLVAIGVWMRLIIEVRSSTQVYVEIIREDTGAVVYSGTHTNTISFQSIALGTRYDDNASYNNQAGDLEVDWIMIRPYNNPSDLSVSLSSEEVYDEDSEQYYGLAISRTGYDVGDADEKNLIYSSKYESPQPIMNLFVPAHSKKAHDLGYIPAFYGDAMRGTLVSVMADETFVYNNSSHDLYITIFLIRLDD